MRETEREEARAANHRSFPSRFRTVLRECNTTAAAATAGKGAWRGAEKKGEEAEGALGEQLLPPIALFSAVPCLNGITTLRILSTNHMPPVPPAVPLAAPPLAVSPRLRRVSTY